VPALQSTVAVTTLVARDQGGLLFRHRGRSVSVQGHRLALVVGPRIAQRLDLGLDARRRLGDLHRVRAGIGHDRPDDDQGEGEQAKGKQQLPQLHLGLLS
jgi:hypothetical protein